MLLITVAVAFFASAAGAESFPSKPVKVIVPYPISGPTDIRGTSRMSRTYRMIALNSPPAVSDALAGVVAQAIRADSPHRVMLERQPGGITTRGAASVARAAADGHSLLLASNATMVINPHYFHGINYDPARDLELVAPLVTMPFVLLARSGLPPESPISLIAWLKPRPGEINYGSSGDGSTGHLAGELFRRLTGVDVVHVSYNGGIAALNALAAGQISLMFAALPLALPYLPNEHFRPLGIASDRRFALLPEVPTLTESGLREFEVEAWFGVFAPARTPATAIVWLNERISAAMRDRATGTVLLTLGLAPVTATSAQFVTRIHSEAEKWAPVVRASRLPLKGGES